MKKSSSMRKDFSVFTIKNLVCCIALMQLALVPQKSQSQVDCNSASGILALMAAPVAINPVDADDFQTNYSLAVSCTTKLFLNPPATISTVCQNAIKMYVFYSTNRNDLTSLPTLASSNPNNVMSKPKVQATLSNAAVANEKKVLATFNSNLYPVGTKVYYRYGKLINHPNDVDPMTWSTIMEFTMPTVLQTISVPTACINPDLKPAPANNNDITLFKIVGGNWSDAAGHTYEQVSGEWCKSFFDGSGLIIDPASGNDPSIGPMRSKVITLPPINWGVRETNNRAVTIAFTNQLLRSGESSPVATFNVTSMTAGSTQMAPPFTARGTRTVFLFEQQNNACAVKTFDATQGHLNVVENNYTVKVDSGNNVTECTDTSSDNQRTYSNGGGTAVVFPR